jgi:cytochrome c5
MIALLTAAALLIFGNAAWAGGPYTKEQLGAKFYFDLGASTINVAAYPQKQQANYSVFTQVCSQCHTLARPINAPIISKEDWGRYVLRMHLETKVTAGTKIDPAEAKRIIDFLAYDSRQRKVERRVDFATETRLLKTRFADVQKERRRLQSEADKRDVRAPTMGVDAQPSPHSQ